MYDNVETTKQTQHIPGSSDLANLSGIYDDILFCKVSLAEYVTRCSGSINTGGVRLHVFFVCHLRCKLPSGQEMVV